MEKKTILISTCLLGIPCQYDGNQAKRLLTQEELEKLKAFHMVPICPEQLSGLPTPRKPVEIIGGTGADVLDGNARVMSKDGGDFTSQFVLGAKLALDIANAVHAKDMVTQRRSPSCSCSGIYDGNFSHVMKDGMGVCAELLHRSDINLISVDEIDTRLST